MFIRRRFRHAHRPIRRRAATGAWSPPPAGLSPTWLGFSLPNTTAIPAPNTPEAAPPRSHWLSPLAWVLGLAWLVLAAMGCATVAPGHTSALAVDSTDELPPDPCGGEGIAREVLEVRGQSRAFVSSVRSGLVLAEDGTDGSPGAWPDVREDHADLMALVAHQRGASGRAWALWAEAAFVAGRTDVADDALAEARRRCPTDAVVVGIGGLVDGDRRHGSEVGRGAAGPR